MNWELAHRRRDEENATHVTVQAPGRWEATGAVRAQIPADELVLCVRRAD
ncbi:MAG: hypothetical protein ABI067_01040 [Leifsonia sp.]